MMLKNFKMAICIMCGCVYSSFGLPQITTQVIQQELQNNWYRISLKVTNLGEEPVNGLEIGWHFNWADHSSKTEVELDYCSLRCGSVRVEERDDYTGTAWITLLDEVKQNDSVFIHFRVHTRDWEGLDPYNDPSWIKRVNGCSVLYNGNVLTNEIPRLEYPPIQVQKIVTITKKMQSSSNTLGLGFELINEGELPLRSISFSWYINKDVFESDIVAKIDYSEVGDIAVETIKYDSGLIEFRFNLEKNYMLPINAHKNIHIRFHSADWTMVNYNNDFSYKGVDDNNGNDRVIIRSDGLHIGGIYPDLLTHSSLNALRSGIPDQNQVQSSSDTIYVVYDFSGIPGYSKRKKIVMPILPNSLLNGRIPEISLIEDAAEYPIIMNRSYVKSGKIFKVKADIIGGREVGVPIPFADSEVELPLPEGVMSYRFDSSLANWQELETEMITGGVLAKSRMFSPVQAGIRVQPFSIAAGKDFVVAIDSMVVNGQIKYRLSFMGNNDSTLEYVTNFNDGVRSVAAEHNTVFVLMINGSVFTSRLLAGKLGVFAKVNFLDESVSIRQISAGFENAYFQDEHGDVWGVGKNDNGQLNVSDTSMDSAIVPLKILLGDDEKTIRPFAISSGRDHSVALDSLGRLWTWGANDKGQLLIPENMCGESSCPGIGCFDAVRCEYKVDDESHAPSLRSFSGYEGWYAKEGNHSVHWRNVTAGNGFSIVSRIPGLPYLPLFVWGSSMDIGTHRPPYSYYISAGSNHFIVLQIEKIYGKEKEYYIRSLFHAGGNNQYGQLGLSNTLERWHTSEKPNARGIAAGDGFSAIWYPGSPTKVQIYGKMGERLFSGEKFEPSTKVEIEDPNEGQHLIKGTTKKVKWKVNGIYQDSLNYEKIPNSGNLNDSFQISRTYVDTYGRSHSATKKYQLVDEPLTDFVLNVGESVNLSYDIYTKYIVEDSANLNMSFYDLNGTLICSKKLVNKGGGFYVNPMCDEKFKIPEGVYLLSVSAEINGKEFLYGMQKLDTVSSSFHLWESTENIENQVADSIHLLKDNWAIVNVFTDEKLSIYKSYVVFYSSIRQKNFVIPIDCEGSAINVNNNTPVRVTFIKRNSSILFNTSLTNDSLAYSWWDKNGFDEGSITIRASNSWSVNILYNMHTAVWDSEVVENGMRILDFYRVVHNIEPAYLRRSSVRIVYNHANSNMTEATHCLGD